MNVVTLLKEERDAINAINTKNLDFAQQQQLEILKADLTRKEKALEYKNEIDKTIIEANNKGFDLKGLLKWNTWKKPCLFKQLSILIQVKSMSQMLNQH